MCENDRRTAVIPIKNRRRMNDNRQIKNFFIRHSNSLNSRHLLNMRQSVFPLSFFRLNILCCENLQAKTLLLFSGLFMLSRMIFLLTSKKTQKCFIRGCSMLKKYSMLRIHPFKCSYSPAGQCPASEYEIDRIERFHQTQ